MKKLCKVLLILFLLVGVVRVYADTNSETTSENTSSESISIGMEHMSCSQLLGNNLMNVADAFIDGIRIFAAIACIVKAMLEILPAVKSKDADALKKAGKTCTIMAVVLCIIGIFPSLVAFVGKIAGLDLSCL